jgi:hypothetical protein
MPVLLNKPGTTMYRIVIPTAPTTQEQKAAEDLAVTLKDITNVDFPVVSDDTMAGEKEISVGNTNRLELEGLVIDKAALGDDGYSIQWKKKNLFLVGGKKRGIINAVYAFLEEDLGCRWYLKEVATLPVRKRLTVRPVSRQYAPPFALRDPYYSTAFDKNWSLRNMTNSPNAPVKSEWGGHWKYALFVHTFNTLLPPDAYFVDHPEYFMMDEAGQRVPRQLCTTNEDVIRIVTENTLAALAENPSANIICVSKNDGGGT